MAHAQVDFGEFLRCDADGNEHKAYELVMSFPYSDKAYAQVFPSQNQECLLIGMRRIFEYIGGVPVRIRFDNMSTAVAQVLEGTERKLTDGFTRFMLHYRFQADFCNPASGNEKGNVENKVGYGLSPELHDETVQAKIFYDKVEFYHDHALVASYRRCYGKNEELMDWTQYVRTLCRKPGAAEHTRFFSAMPLPWQSYLSQTRGQERKSALQLLDDIVRDGNAEFCVDILTLAQQNGRSDVDSVKQCYYSLLKEGSFTIRSSIPLPKSRT